MRTGDEDAARRLLGDRRRPARPRQLSPAAHPERRVEPAARAQAGDKPSGADLVSGVRLAGEDQPTPDGRCSGVDGEVPAPKGKLFTPAFPERGVRGAARCESVHGGDRCRREPGGHDDDADPARQHRRGDFGARLSRRRRRRDGSAGPAVAGGVDHGVDISDWAGSGGRLAQGDRKAEGYQAGDYGPRPMPQRRSGVPVVHGSKLVGQERGLAAKGHSGSMRPAGPESSSAGLPARAQSAIACH